MTIFDDFKNAIKNHLGPSKLPVTFGANGVLFSSIVFANKNLVLICV